MTTTAALYLPLHKLVKPKALDWIRKKHMVINRKAKYHHHDLSICADDEQRRGDSSSSSSTLSEELPLPPPYVSSKTPLALSNHCLGRQWKGRQARKASFKLTFLFASSFSFLAPTSFSFPLAFSPTFCSERWLSDSVEQQENGGSEWRQNHSQQLFLSFSPS